MADLMFMSADYTLNFVKLLIAASKDTDFAKKRGRTRGITRHEQATIEKRFQMLEKAFRRSATSYSDNAYAAALTTAYLRKVLGNARIASYLIAVHPELFEEMRAGGSLESSVRGMQVPIKDAR